MQNKHNVEIFKNEHLKFDIYLDNHFEVVKVLNQNIKGYTGKYIVFDKYEFWQIEEPFNTKEEAMEYIDRLKEVTDKQSYYYLKWCKKSNVREGSLIEFEDGKRGVISSEEKAIGCLKFSLIKKDGTVGKSIRNLYEGMDFKIIAY